MRIPLHSLAILMIATMGLTACQRTMNYEEATAQKDPTYEKDWQLRPWERNNHSN